MRHLRRICALSGLPACRDVSLGPGVVAAGGCEGRCVYYRLEPRGVKPLIDWIAHYRAFWTEHVDRLEELLEKMDE